MKHGFLAPLFKHTSWVTRESHEIAFATSHSANGKGRSSLITAAGTIGLLFSSRFEAGPAPLLGGGAVGGHAEFFAEAIDFLAHYIAARLEDADVLLGTLEARF
jgi:hypothetical protein